MTIALVSCASTTGTSASNSSAAIEEIVEVACATCIYDIQGVTGCVTAVKIGGTPYLLAGAELDAHNSGLCDSAKHAHVHGKVQDGKFVASSIKLVAKK